MGQPLKHSFQNDLEKVSGREVGGSSTSFMAWRLTASVRFLQEILSYINRGF